MRVLDAFPVVRLGFAAADDVRRRVQQQTCGHRGRRTDPLYGIRRVLRRGAENLSTPAWARLLAGIEAGDEHGQVAAAWVAAQELRAIYHCRDGDQAAARLYAWTVTCIDSHVPELRRLARTLTTWRGVPGLLPHRPNQQWPHRSGQPADQENPEGRTRLPQFW